MYFKVSYRKNPETEGFIKYSNVFEGHMADSKTLTDIVDNLRIKTSENEKRAVMVIDAGIATEDNLELLVAKGYDYVCISRSKLKDYTLSEGNVTHKVLTKNKEELELKRVHNPSHADYYLQVKSPGKIAKESRLVNILCKLFFVLMINLTSFSKDN